MKASLQQISVATGFSTATVSNALNHKRGVNAETASRILEAARRLGVQVILVRRPADSGLSMAELCKRLEEWT